MYNLSQLSFMALNCLRTENITARYMQILIRLYSTCLIAPFNYFSSVFFIIVLREKSVSDKG